MLRFRLFFSEKRIVSLVLLFNNDKAKWLLLQFTKTDISLRVNEPFLLIQSGIYIFFPLWTILDKFKYLASLKYSSIFIFDFSFFIKWLLCSGNIYLNLPIDLPTLLLPVYGKINKLFSSNIFIFISYSQGLFNRSLLNILSKSVSSREMSLLLNSES